jgi:hypothetical protein
MRTLSRKLDSPYGHGDNMKERPILFSAPMVRAILNGRKTQTRRVVRKQPEDVGAVRIGKMADFWDGTPRYQFESNSGKIGIFKPPYVKCPYGAVGDRLWVRETWAPVNDYGVEAIAYRADTELWQIPKDENFNFIPPVPEKWCFGLWAGDLISGVEKGWKPSIHMPRWASRITLDVTGIRVERLQDISEDDARAEGCKPLIYGSTYRDGFISLWDSINGKKHPWESNPWVWVVEFKKL